MLPPPPPLPLFFRSALRHTHEPRTKDTVRRCQGGQYRKLWSTRREEESTEHRAREKKRVYCTRSLWSVYLLWLFAILINCEFCTNDAVADESVVDWICVFYSFSLSPSPSVIATALFIIGCVCVCKNVCLFCGLCLYALNPVTIERYSLVETKLHFKCTNP